MAFNWKLPFNGDKLKEWMGGNRATQLIVVAGIAGIVLIFLSSFMSNPTEEDTPITQAQGSLEATNADQYAALLEERLTDIISSIDGVGETRVLITMAQGPEYIYAQDEKVTQENTEEVNGEDSYRTQDKTMIDQSYIFVETTGGRKQALLTTQLEPTVRGVIVVCAGGDNVVIVQKVIEAVCTALDIPSNRVCVLKLG